VNRVIWSPRATRDLLGIIDYIALSDEDLAEALYTRILGTVERLRDFPQRGRRGRRGGTRELLISGTAYVAAYSTKGDRVNILRVLHTAQNWQGHG
jgi:addiction module RelE/StbE family toxin